MTDAPEVIVVKNYDLRRRIVALTVVPALLLASIVAAIPVVLIGGTTVTITMGIAVTIIAELVVIFWALWFTGFIKTWPEMLYFKNFKWKYVLLGAVVGQVFYWGLQGIAYLFSLAGSPVSSSDTSTSIGALEGIEAVIIIFLFVPFIVPFIEEFLFRGVIIGSLLNSKWKATWISVVVSAVSFGVLHVQGFSTVTDFAIFAWITLMGAAFAYLYIKTKSFWTVFVAHSIYNLTSSFFIFTGIGS